MTKAEEYRRRAEEADAQALACRDAEVQLTFREIARQWRHLADQWDHTWNKGVR